MAVDLTSLTKQEKLRLWDLLEEKTRRKRERGAVYNPNQGQITVHTSEKTLRCVFSGNGSGKTALAANEAIWWAQGFNPITEKFSQVPARIVYVTDHPEKVTDLILPELQKWTLIKDTQLHKRGKPYVSRISFPNGSEILFMFHDQSPLIFESIELDYAIFDEPPPRNVYISLRRGGRKKNRPPRFLLVGTPIACPWMRTEIQDPWAQGKLPDTEVFKFSTEVNRANLADHFIEGFSAVLSEREKRIRLDGEFFDLEGLALAHLFDRSTHIVAPFDWDREFPVVVAIDPHSAKPHHAVMLGVNRDNEFFVLKEIREKAVPREFAARLRTWMEGYRVIDIICDSLGSSEYSGGEGFKSFIQVLNDNGVRARSTTFEEKSDEDWIERIRQCLAMPAEPNNFGICVPKLRVFSTCRGLINDIENVQWMKIKNSEDFKPKLDITNKDFLSCLKYALATHLYFDKTRARIYKPIRGPETYGIRRESPNRTLRQIERMTRPQIKARKEWDEF